jgi:transcription initiation factor TFIID subunit 9B
MFPPGTPVQQPISSSPMVMTPSQPGLPMNHGTPTMTRPMASTSQSQPAPSNMSLKTQDPQFIPRDAKLTSILLNALGIENTEPQVIPMVLEFMHRYTLHILQDAQVFSEHAGRSEITVEDVKLAITSRLGHSFINPPSKDVSRVCISDIQYMMDLAEKKNSQPLPLIPEKFGIRLPPERYALTATNFQVLPQVR